MPYFENNVYLYFKKEITESANEKIKQLKEEIEEYKKDSLKKMEAEIKENMDKIVETEINELNQEFSAAMNRIKIKTHQEIIKKKHELLDLIISNVKDKCLTFVKTKKYQLNMESLIANIENKFCGDHFLFKISRNDKLLEKTIKEKYKKSYKIEKVDTIKIGGFVGICTKKGILTDQTIDNKLEEARKRFFEKSKLTTK